MNVQTKLKQNIEAIRICLENSNKKLSSQQIEQVSKFSGWGMCKAVLYDQAFWENASIEDKKLRPLIDELHKLLQEELTGRDYKKVVESMKNAVLTSFFTPAVIPATFYEVLNKYMAVESMCEPSAGMGVFIKEAIGKLSLYNKIIAYDKELITGKLLSAILQYDGYNSHVRIKGFEESGIEDNDEYELVVSNIPFGAIPVYAPEFDKSVTTKIHNYFFAKGLTKLREGGILAYVVTSAFLDTVTNRSAREYLFNRADFISLTVFPDNLFKESGGTEAASHFLVVRKNSSKTELSAEEQLLCVSENVTREGQNGIPSVVVSMNKYLQQNEWISCIGMRKLGTNQYGKPTVETTWGTPIEQIEEPFRAILQRDFAKRYSTDTQSINHESDNVSDEILPWEELQDHIVLPKDDIADIADDYEEEGLPIEQLQHVAEELDRIGKEAGIMPEDWETGKIEQTEPVKKELSKRDKSVLEEYYKIKKAYTNLQNGTDT